MIPLHDDRGPATAPVETSRLLLLAKGVGCRAELKVGG